MDIDSAFIDLQGIFIALGVLVILGIQHWKKRQNLMSTTVSNRIMKDQLGPADLISRILTETKNTSEVPPPPKRMSPSSPPSQRLRLSSRDWSNDADMGAIFGLDVGGTLSKLVYFEKTMEEPLQEELEKMGTIHTLDEVLTVDDDEIEGKVCHGHRRSTSNPQQSPSNPHSPIAVDSSDLSLSRPTLKRVASLGLLDHPLCQKTMQAFYTFMAAQSGNHYIESLVHEANLSFTADDLGGKLNFLLFETHHIERVMSLMRQHRLDRMILTLGCTGGGSFKYQEKLRDVLNIDIVSIDEMESLVRGLEFVISKVVGECYTYKPCTWPVPSQGGGEKDWTMKVNLDYMTQAEFPFLLVSIGSGVSIIRVDGPGQFQRVSGSSIGGGTFFGLARLISGCSSFDELLLLAERGNHEECDMLVGDIYGRQYGKVGLSSNIVASSFGKLMNLDEPMESTLPEDRVRALLMMITNNIGQVAYLNALQQNTKHIYFIGNFLRHNQISCQRLSYAIDYWSGKKMEALFLRHEGYLGAMGAFMMSADR